MATRKTTRKSTSTTSSKAKETKNMATQTVDAPPADDKATPTRKRNKKPAFPVDAEKKISLDLAASDYTLPEGYDPEKMAPLKKGHFDTERSFIVYKAIKAEQEAAALRQEAADWKPEGNLKRQKDKMDKLRDKMKEEADKLVKLGMDATEAKAYLEQLLADM